jgi:DNA-binding Xre family transcriptional regulator
MLQNRHPAEREAARAVMAVLHETRTTKQDLAKTLGTTRGALSSRLSGASRLRVGDLHDIAHALGCHPADLLHGSAHALTHATENGNLRNPGTTPTCDR